MTFGALGPDQKLVWFSIAQETDGYFSQIVRRDGVAISDASGVVRVKLDSDVPRRSFWFVIDFATGAFAAATPRDYPLREVSLAPGALQPDSLGKVSILSHQRNYVELLVLRPGKGSWKGSAGEGAKGDSDGEQDGVLNVAVSDMEPLEAGSPPPDQFAPGDVVVTVDAERMEFSAVRLVL